MRASTADLSLAGGVRRPRRHLDHGCISAVLADGQIEATRRAAVAVNTIADYELQRSATEAGIAQFEGMHLLRPNNTDGLFLLTQAWGGYAFAFVPEDVPTRTRSIARGTTTSSSVPQEAAARLTCRPPAVFFGLELLSHRADGFEASQAQRGHRSTRQVAQRAVHEPATTRRTCSGPATRGSRGSTSTRTTLRWSPTCSSASR